VSGAFVEEQSDVIRDVQPVSQADTNHCAVPYKREKRLLRRQAKEVSHAHTGLRYMPAGARKTALRLLLSPIVA